MTGDWVFWLGWIGAAVVYAVMIYIAWRALFHDRGKGKRRCPKCWHDLSHTPGMTCSECGFTATSESQLHRTRRHKSLAVLAVLICLIVAVVLNWQVDQRGWAGVVPTKALIWSLPLTIEDGGSSLDELERRMRIDQLSDGEWLMLLRRCAEGDAWRRPPDDEWAQTYGDLLHTWRRRLATSIELELQGERNTGQVNGPAARFQKSMNELLLSIPPRVKATTRADWPAGISPRVNLTLEDWWPMQCDTRMEVTPAVEGAEAAVVYRTSAFVPRIPFSMPVQGWGDEGPPDLDIVVQRRWGDDGQWATVHSAQLSVEAIEPSAASAKTATMEPVTSETMETAMMRAFGQGVVQWPSGPSPVRFRVNVPATSGSAFADTAVGVKVELKRGDELARRLDLWWLGGTPIDRRYGFEIAHENLELLKLLPSTQALDDSNWTLTVTGVEAIAQRAGPAGSYWSGQVEAPLAVVQQPGTSPPRPWWTQEQIDDSAAEGQPTAE